MEMHNKSEIEKKWRLLLGSETTNELNAGLSETEAGMDAALGALYEIKRKGFVYGENQNKSKKGGREASSPSVARWLGDIRKYFPNSTVELLQKDALQEDSLKEILLLEPEILEQSTPDVNLVATLLNLGKLIPEKTKETARKVVQTVVDELMKKLEQKTKQSLTGALNKLARKNNPKYNEIDWNQTIKKNLKNYLPEYKTIIPEIKIGYGRKSKSTLKQVVLCLDQSGSMGSSVVYSGIFGAVMASMPAIKTQMIVFDTQVADLTEDLTDPVDLLFGVQLGGGTDINLALSYCQNLITQPEDTIMVLITDLFEGGNAKEMLQRAKTIKESGCNLICLLALCDDGNPYYDVEMARAFNKLQIPVFGCTPEMFPDLMAAAIQKNDIYEWAGQNNVVLKGV